jgi:hypothetical protein
MHKIIASPLMTATPLRHAAETSPHLLHGQRAGRSRAEQLRLASGEVERATAMPIVSKAHELTAGRSNSAARRCLLCLTMADLTGDNGDGARNAITVSGFVPES